MPIPSPLRRCFGPRGRYYILLTLIFAVAAVWLWPVGYMADDMVYRHVLIPYPTWQQTCRLFGPPLQSYSDTLHSTLNHWMYVNGRLSDKLYILLANIPGLPHLVNLFSAAAIALMIWAVYKAAANRCSAGLLLLCLILSLWLLPWAHLFSRLTYVINYVLPAAGLMIVIWLLNKPLQPTRRNRMLLCTLCLLTAWTHEIFAGALLVYMAARLCYGYIINTASHGVKVSMWLYLLCAAAGAVLVFLSPGTSARAGSHLNEYDFQALWNVRVHVLYATLPAIAALALLAASTRSRLMRAGGWLGSGDMWASVAALLYSMAVVCYFHKPGRFAWCGDVLAIYVILKVVNTACPNFVRLLGRPAAWIAGCLIFIYGGIEVARVQHQTSNDQNRAFETLKRTGGPVVEVEAFDDQQWPWFVGAFILPPENFINSGAIQVEARAIGCRKPIMFVPKGLKDKPLTHWPKVPGHNELYGINGIYYTPSQYADRVYTMTVGRPVASESPLEWLYNTARRLQLPDGEHYTTGFNYNYAYIGEFHGQPVHLFFVGFLRRGTAACELISIDSIPSSSTLQHP